MCESSRLSQTGARSRLGLERAIRACGVLAASLTLVVVLGGEAQAGFARSQFDLGNSTVTIVTEITSPITATLSVTIPESQGGDPTGSVAGGFSVVFPVVGSNLTLPSTGSGAITALDLSVNLSVDAGALLLDGYVNSTNVGWGTGTFDPSNVVKSPVGALVLQSDTYLECTDVGTAALCAELPDSFPISRIATKPSSKPLTVTVNSLSNVSHAWFSALLTLDIAAPSATEPFLARVQLIGQEIGGTREMTSYVPEPGAGVLLASGSLALGALGAVLSRTRRRGERSGE